jgi:hypothetical protein
MATDGPQGPARQTADVVAEVRQMEMQYNHAVEQVEQQKEQALDWIARQKSKMLLQLNGLATDRELLGNKMQQCHKEWNDVQETVL